MDTKKGGVVTTPPFFMRLLFGEPIRRPPRHPAGRRGGVGQNSKWTEPITVRGAPKV